MQTTRLSERLCRTGTHASRLDDLNPVPLDTDARTDGAIHENAEERRIALDADRQKITAPDERRGHCRSPLTSKRTGPRRCA